MIYTVTLNPSIDYVVRLSAPLLTGGLNRSTEDICQYGGKGINVSGVLRTLGLASVTMGFIGGFTGDALEKGLTDMGQRTDFTRVDQGMTRINVKVKAGTGPNASRADGITEETEINGVGPKVSNAALQAFLSKLHCLQPQDVLVLSGSVPASLPEDIYACILRQADLVMREHWKKTLPEAITGAGNTKTASDYQSILTVVDTSGSPLLRTLAYHPFLIKPNIHELQELLGKAVHSTEEAIAGANRLRELGARNVLISMGGDGAILVGETGQVYLSAAPRGKVLNSVGAGDSMVAGFLAGYLRTKDAAYALRLGVSAGSATAFSIGLATRKQIDTLFAEQGF